MELVVKENFILEERRISLSEFHTANEVLSAYNLSVFKGSNRIICASLFLYKYLTIIVLFF